MAKVLVIDDDEGIRHLLDTFLQERGYEVLLAEDGYRGLELFERHHPHIIVLDLDMRRMDGLGVLRHLRGLNQDQRVIIFTGACDPTTAQRVRALGVTDIVGKGSSLYTLAQTLKRALESQGAAAAIDG